jgi:hypothetical protein
LQDRVVVGRREHRRIDRVARALGLAAFEQVLLRGAGLGGDLLTAQAEQVADRVCGFPRCASSDVPAET